MPFMLKSHSNCPLPEQAKVLPNSQNPGRMREGTISFLSLPQYLQINGSSK